MNLLERTLDDIARDGRETTEAEKLLRGLERNLGQNLERNLGQNLERKLGQNLERNLEEILDSKQLCAMCTNSLLDWSNGK